MGGGGGGGGEVLKILLMTPCKYLTHVWWVSRKMGCCTVSESGTLYGLGIESMFDRRIGSMLYCSIAMFALQGHTNGLCFVSHCMYMMHM